VDDEEVKVEIGNSMLKKLGNDETSVARSLEALEIFQKSPQQFDLVVTDLQMPGLTGDRLAQKLIRLRPDLPIIMCTGFSERFDQNRARALGIRRFIMKPLAMDVFAVTIREVLDEPT
jgi:CheY-like chemotaxis protein